MTTSDVYEAPGLTADWLNGWLAAIGVTVMLPGVKLSWSDEPTPVALFSGPHVGDLPTAVASVLPTVSDLDHSTIRWDHPQCTHKLDYKVTLAAYRERVALERAKSDSPLGGWCLVGCSGG
jgi:hypothetical protein